MKLLLWNVCVFHLFLLILQLAFSVNAVFFTFIYINQNNLVMKIRLCDSELNANEARINDFLSQKQMSCIVGGNRSYDPDGSDTEKDDKDKPVIPPIYPNYSESTYVNYGPGPRTK